jgi:hypothetical protein
MAHQKHSNADFIKLEYERISFDKWIEGCRTSADPGIEWVLNWVRRNAAIYRKEWNESVCQCCAHCLDKDDAHHYRLDENTRHFCGLNMVCGCDQFKEMEDSDEKRGEES